MRRLIWTALFLLLLFIFCAAAFLAGGFASQFAEGIGPTYASDHDVAKLIQPWVGIPAEARNLTIFEEGLVSSDVWISLEMPADERVQMMDEWLGKAKVHPIAIPSSQFFRYAPPHPTRNGDSVDKYDSRVSTSGNGQTRRDIALATT